MSDTIKFGTDGWRGVIARITHSTMSACLTGLASYMQEAGQAAPRSL